MKKIYISFDEACHLIKKGGIVAIPTETVYGLAGSVFSETALKKIFHIKKRPFFNPLIIHCANTKQMTPFFSMEQDEKNKIFLKKIIAHFSPGPITFILNKTSAVHPIITAGQKKVGLRIPKHPLTLKLIKETTPLCAPSANLFGKLSPTRAKHVYSIFKNKVPILDGGECQVGIESTILEPDFKNNTLNILRPGLISKNHLQKWLKKEKYIKWAVQFSSSPLSPGQLNTHYQPAVPLVIIELENQVNPTKTEITRKLFPLFPDKIFKQLKLNSSAAMSARTLYHQLNTLSQDPTHVIYIIKYRTINNSGGWQAIWNRLDKACSRRIKWRT